MCYTLLLHFAHCGHVDISFHKCDDSNDAESRGQTRPDRNHSRRWSMAHSLRRPCVECWQEAHRRWGYQVRRNIAGVGYPRHAAEYQPQPARFELGPRVGEIYQLVQGREIALAMKERPQQAVAELPAERMLTTAENAAVMRQVRLMEEAMGEPYALNARAEVINHTIVSGSWRMFMYNTGPEQDDEEPTEEPTMRLRGGLDPPERRTRTAEQSESTIPEDEESHIDIVWYKMQPGLGEPWVQVARPQTQVQPSAPTPILPQPAMILLMMTVGRDFDVHLRTFHGEPAPQMRPGWEERSVAGHQLRGRLPHVRAFVARLMAQGWIEDSGFRIAHSPPVTVARGWSPPDPPPAEHFNDEDNDETLATRQLSLLIRTRLFGWAMARFDDGVPQPLEQAMALREASDDLRYGLGLDVPPALPEDSPSLDGTPGTMSATNQALVEFHEATRDVIPRVTAAAAQRRLVRTALEFLPARRQIEHMHAINVTANAQQHQHSVAGPNNQMTMRQDRAQEASTSGAEGGSVEATAESSMSPMARNAGQNQVIRAPVNAEIENGTGSCGMYDEDWVCNSPRCKNRCRHMDRSEQLLEWTVPDFRDEEFLDGLTDRGTEYLVFFHECGHYNAVFAEKLHPIQVILEESLEGASQLTGHARCNCQLTSENLVARKWGTSRGSCLRCRRMQGGYEVPDNSVRMVDTVREIELWPLDAQY